MTACLDLVLRLELALDLFRGGCFELGLRVGVVGAGNALAAGPSAGLLDATGRGTATFYANAGVDPALVGLTAHHAALVFDGGALALVTHAHSSITQEQALHRVILISQSSEPSPAGEEEGGR